MAANSYYNPQSLVAHEQNQHLLSPTMSSPGISSFPSTPVKSHHFVSTDQTQYQHGPALEEYNEVKDAGKSDAFLKATIRHLRLVSRTVALLISIAVLVPMSMTLVKFLRTQNVYLVSTKATGERGPRTAWAKGTKAWPTYMYFSVAALSVILNFTTLVSYKFGVAKANTASYIASGFSWVVLVGNVVVWSIAASVYRAEKGDDKTAKDIWGWTCNAPAVVKKDFEKQVNFNQYCDIQTIGFKIGVAQAAAALLTVFIYVLVYIRQRSKKNHKQKMRLSGMAGQVF